MYAAKLANGFSIYMKNLNLQVPVKRTAIL